MALNFDLPRLRKRAQHEIDKVGNAADDTGRGGIGLPSIDLGGTLDNALGTARKALGDARRTLSEGGEQVAHGAQQVAGRAGDVGHAARGAFDDLRSVRITREKPRRDMWPGLALIVGIVGGIAAMFLFDPQDGKRRRALLRDKAGKWTRIASETAQGKAKDLRNRSQGLIHETRKALGGGDEESDAPAPSETAGESTWVSHEPVGASVGVGAGVETPTTTYGDVPRQPSAPNGRDY